MVSVSSFSRYSSLWYRNIVLQSITKRNCSSSSSRIRQLCNSSNNRTASSIFGGLVQKENTWLRYYSATVTIHASDAEKQDLQSSVPISGNSSSTNGNDADNESFKVTKISTETGKIRMFGMVQQEILQETTLSPRDLVSLQLTTRKERNKHNRTNTLVEQMRFPPTIYTRNKFILLSLGPVRAVAEPDAIYLFDVHNKAAYDFTFRLAKMYKQRSIRIRDQSNPANAATAAEVKRRTNKEQDDRRDPSSPSCCLPGNNNSEEEPTELVFLEFALADSVDSFTSRIRIFEPIVNDLLHRISTTKDFSEANLVHQMAPLEEQLKSFEVFVGQAYECLTQLLNDDEAMLQLLVTEQEEARKTNVEVDFDRHQHVEHILGIYARRFNSIVQETNHLLGRIESQQDFIELELDLYRNRMIKMNVDLAILATATGVTTALTGTFGMNMINGLENSASAFMVVSASSACIALGVARYFSKRISGATIQERAEQRMDEIQTMANALSDMTALDYTVKKMLKDDNVSMGKQEFQQQLQRARRSKQCTNEEAELLFNVLNTHKDDVLGKDDFRDDKDDVLSKDDFRDDKDDLLSKADLPDDKDGVLGKDDDDDDVESLPNYRRWKAVLKMQEEDPIFEAKVKRINQGGAICFVKGLRAFIPSRELTLPLNKDLIGQKLPLKFMNVNYENQTIFVSNRKAVVGTLMAGLSPGDVVEGVVQNVAIYGAFIDVRGMKGLLHVSQISSDYVIDIEQIFHPGMAIKCMISELNQDGSFTLNTKHLEPNPGDMIRDPAAVFAQAEETAEKYRAKLQSNTTPRMFGEYQTKDSRDSSKGPDEEAKLLNVLNTHIRNNDVIEAPTTTEDTAENETDTKQS